MPWCCLISLTCALLRVLDFVAVGRNPRISKITNFQEIEKTHFGEQKYIKNGGFGKKLSENTFYIDKCYDNHHYGENDYLVFKIYYLVFKVN